MRPLSLSMAPLLALFALAGCGTGPAPAEDDAAVESPDASMPVDASSVADTGPPDEDGDGIPTGRDCNDADRSVGTTGDRPCSTMCGSGVEACAEGVWGACSASTDCLCTMAGATRAAACGNCGMQMETCTSGRWTATSGCIGQGCMPGAVETETGSQCFERQRICSAECAWSDWEVTRPAGPCVPGACEPLIGQMCTEECVWVPATEC